MASENQWAFDLETKIYSIVKSRVTAQLKKISKYSNAFITNVEKSTSDATFPTIYIHELPGVEKGNDLEGTAINAILETFQVDVITNTSQSDAKRIIAIVTDEFKKLRFQITAMPEFDSSGETYRSTMRLRRLIGANDIL